MSRYIEITINGERIKKHYRDVKKDTIICSHIPKYPCRIFEASAGKAILARQLKEAGHDITISNYSLQHIPHLKEIQIDLNKNIPLPDNIFDIIICREVIEHLESVPHTLREFNRILKPGGKLILTFPNRLQIRSRFYYLLCGFYRGMKSPINLDVPFGEAHINLIGYPEMDYFLRKTNFDVTHVQSSYFQKSDFFFLLFKPLIALTTYYFLLYHKKNAEEHDKTKPENFSYNKFVARTLLSTDLFIGKDVIIVAKKLV